MDGIVSLEDLRKFYGDNLHHLPILWSDEDKANELAQMALGEFDHWIEEQFLWLKLEASIFLSHLPEGQWFKDLVLKKAEEGGNLRS